MKPERIRVVVVGTGGIGKHHVRIWGDIAAAEVVGVYDVNQASAQAAAEQYGVGKVYASLEEAVGEPTAHAVDICTPNMYHRAGVVAALEAGKHCLCEKPLAVTPAEILTMIDARNRSGKLLCTIQHMRFEQRTQALKRLIAAGRLGEVYYTRAWWLRRRAAPATPGFLSREQAGHGPGIDLGVHMLDLALYLSGNPKPISVMGLSMCKLAHQPDVGNQWGTFRAEDYEVEDFVAGLIRFADGSALSLESSWLLNMLPHELQGVWLHGTRGGATWPDLRLSHVEQGALIDSQITSDQKADGHRNQMAAFADAIINNGPSPVPTEQSLAVAQILEAIYESAASEREVRLDPPAS